MLDKYYRINKATGVSIHINSDTSSIINACDITLDNKQLNFGKKLTGLVSLDILKQYIIPKSIIAVNLSGRGILTKQIEKTDEINADNFNKILPNANLDDFYIQNFISGETSFVSVIRKTDADKWIDELKNLSFVPLSLSLGPFSIQNVISQLNVYGSQLSFDGHSIHFDDAGNWNTNNYHTGTVTQFPLKIELEPIDEQLVLPYAVAFQLLLDTKTDLIQANIQTLTIAFQKQVANNRLKFNSFVILAIFFVLLLINFIIFSWLDSANSTLSGQVSRSAQSFTDVQSLKKKIEQKEDLLTNLDWEEDINKSKLVDQIASLLPPELTWQEVAIDPVNVSATRSAKSLMFYNREIKISGNSDKIIPVNEWIARVKTRRWVKNIQLDDYTFNSELNTGQFTITIGY